MPTGLSRYTGSFQATSVNENLDQQPLLSFHDISREKIIEMGFCNVPLVGSAGKVTFTIYDMTCLSIGIRRISIKYWAQFFVKILIWPLKEKVL